MSQGKSTPKAPKSLRVISGRELAAMPVPTLEQRMQGNVWTHDPDLQVVQYHKNGRWIYEVDLERVTSAEDVCDWLAHISKKAWATPTVLGDLVRALDATVGLFRLGQDRGS